MTYALQNNNLAAPGVFIRRRLPDRTPLLKCHNKCYVGSLIPSQMLIAFGIALFAIFLPLAIAQAPFWHNVPPKPILSIQERIRAIAKMEQYPADKLLAMAFYESSFRPLVRGDHGKARGLFQIRSDYWPEITDEQAFDPEWSTLWTINQLKSGHGHFWSCWNIIK